MERTTDSDSKMKSKYDVVILGAGHNGLVAASYLGRAGLSVLLLEKNDYIGGATTSQKVFPDYEARLSRYSYLVSLLPDRIMADLGLSDPLPVQYARWFQRPVPRRTWRRAGRLDPHHRHDQVAGKDCRACEQRDGLGP